MAAVNKAERLGDLVTLLLHTPRPLRLQEIVHDAFGYPADEESARKALQRDIADLEADGIVVTRSDFKGTPAYRIRAEDYYLPDLALTAEESLALNLAVAAVRLEGTAGEEALWKLGASPLAGEPVAALPVPGHLPALQDAAARRAVARFTYSDVAARARTVGRAVPPRLVVRGRPRPHPR